MASLPYAERPTLDRDETARRPATSSLEELGDYLRRGGGIALKRKIRARRSLFHRHLPYDVEDVVQDTFLRILARLRNAGPAAIRDLDVYVLSAAHHTLCDMGRATSREQRLQSALRASSRTGDGQSSPSDVDIGDPLARSIVRAYLTELPSDLTAVYRERYCLNHSERDSAEALGLSYHSLRALERRLLDGLTKRLKIATAKKRPAVATKISPSKTRSRSSL